MDKTPSLVFMKQAEGNLDSKQRVGKLFFADQDFCPFSLFFFLKKEKISPGNFTLVCDEKYWKIKNNKRGDWVHGALWSSPDQAAMSSTLQLPPSLTRQFNPAGCWLATSDTNIPTLNGWATFQTWNVIFVTCLVAMMVKNCFWNSTQGKCLQFCNEIEPVSPRQSIMSRSVT